MAQVSAVDEPATSADSAAHLRTIHFCSEDGPASTIAQYLLDLPAESRGRFKAVALDPSDSTQVIESNEVVFNGGAWGEYPTVILRATSIHQSTEFRLHVVGIGLASVLELQLAAVDHSWRQPLAVFSQSDGSVFATAQLAAQVPECAVEAMAGDTLVASALVPADPPPPSTLLLDDPEGCERRMREVWPDHDPYLIQPKDFAFVPGGWTPSGSWTFHLFYIRKNQYLQNADTEKNIGHAVSDSLGGWTVIDTAAIRTRGGRFDSLHVWAPSIVRRGLTYHMFYAAADVNSNQRIGHATSTDLITWIQGDSVLEVTSLNPNQIPWADPTPTPGGVPYQGQTQLRDPFVMEDPDVPGDWLMYFATVSRDYSPEMVVGVARSHGDFDSWGETYPLWNTHREWVSPLGQNGPYVVESPHAFLRDGRWWLFSTIDNDSVWCESNEFSPIDTVSAGARWSPVQKLLSLVPPLQAFNVPEWHATEYLQMSEANDIEYLAAWNDVNVCISITQMQPASSPYLFGMGCPSAADVEDVRSVVRVPGLQLIGMRPAHSRVALRVELPARMRVQLVVYDVMGRRLRTIADGELPQGRTDLVWDGRDGSGSLAKSGVYFVRLAAGRTGHTVSVPLIR